MTTIVNTPAPSTNNSVNGIFIGMFFVILGLVFFFYGIPALKGLKSPSLNVQAPPINIPNKIDVNVKQTP
jgi:hypothetical protein